MKVERDGRKAGWTDSINSEAHRASQILHENKRWLPRATVEAEAQHLAIIFPLLDGICIASLVVDSAA